MMQALGGASEREELERAQQSQSEANGVMQDKKNIPVLALDANALISIGRNDPLLWRLLIAARDGEAKLIVPYVAFKEMVRRRALKHVESYSRDRMKASDELPNLAVLMDNITWEWGQAFERCNVEFIPIKPEHMGEAERRRRNQLPPFTGRTGPQHDNDFRDTLIFCAVSDVSIGHSDMILVCGDEGLRKAVTAELKITVRKDGKKLLGEMFGNDGAVNVDPFKVPSRGGREYLEGLKEKYSHPEFELIQPDRSHNEFNIEIKLNEITQDFKDQVCCVLAIARLFQPARVDEAIAALKSAPFSYSDHACNAALDVLTGDGSIRLVGGTIIIQDDDFAEQAIGRLGDRVIDLMRMFHE